MLQHVLLKTKKIFTAECFNKNPTNILLYFPFLALFYVCLRRSGGIETVHRPATGHHYQPYGYILYNTPTIDFLFSTIGTFLSMNPGIISRKPKDHRGAITLAKLTENSIKHICVTCHGLL